MMNQVNSSMPPTKQESNSYTSPVKRTTKRSQQYTDTFNGKLNKSKVIYVELTSLKEASTAMNSHIKSAQKPTRNFARAGGNGTNQATGGFVTNSHNICQYGDDSES